MGHLCECFVHRPFASIQVSQTSANNLIPFVCFAIVLLAGQRGPCAALGGCLYRKKIGSPNLGFRVNFMLLIIMSLCLIFVSEKLMQENKLLQGIWNIAFGNYYAVLWSVYCTLEDAQYYGGYHHDYVERYHQYIGRCSVTWWIFSTVSVKGIHKHLKY